MDILESLILLISMISGPMLLKNNIHFFSYLSWIIIKVLDTTEQHLGYNFPINPIRILPYGIDNKHHDLHHTLNCGNYGGWMTILDKIFNT